LINGINNYIFIKKDDFMKVNTVISHVIVELGTATTLTMGGGNFGIESFTLKPFMPSK
jgi:hypothetical protein